MKIYFNFNIFATFALLFRLTKINVVTTCKKNFAIFVVDILNFDIIAKNNLIFKNDNNFLTNISNNSSTNNFDFENSLNILLFFFFCFFFLEFLDFDIEKIEFFDFSLFDNCCFCLSSIDNNFISIFVFQTIFYFLFDILINSKLYKLFFISISIIFCWVNFAIFRKFLLSTRL